jgi:predicted alpha/beta hydrolase family esterase
MATATRVNSTVVLNRMIPHLLRSAFSLASRIAPAMAIRAAARLMITPMASSRSRAKAAANRAAMQFLTVGQHRLAVYTWGNPERQPYVLFAHGWSSYGMRVEPWVTSLVDAGFALVSFDQQAHGLSSGTRATMPDFADNVIAVGRHFGPAAGVVAHSLGGAATLRALRRGLKAERVVLIAPAADMAAATRRFARFIGLAEHLCARLIGVFERRSAESFEDMQAHRNVPLIARPLLVVHDFNDREVPWEEGERYVRHASDGRLLSTSGLDHHRIVADAWVITSALRFLSGQSVGERVVSSPNLPFGVL